MHSKSFILEVSEYQLIHYYRASTALGWARKGL
jgi:hypothetical protein